MSQSVRLEQRVTSPSILLSSSFGHHYNNQDDCQDHDHHDLEGDLDYHDDHDGDRDAWSGEVVGWH